MNGNVQSLTPESTSAPQENVTCHLEPTNALAYRGNGKVARLPKTVRDQINSWLLEGISYPDIIQRLGDLGKDLKPDNLSQWKKRGHQDWLLEQAWLAETRSRQEPASDLSADFDATQLNHAALQLGTLQIFEVLRDLTHPGSPSSVVQRDDSGTSAQIAQHISQAAPAQAPSPPLDESEGERRPCILSKQNDPRTGGNALNQVLDEVPDMTQRRPTKRLLDRRLGGDSAAFVRLISALVRASRETMLVQKYRDACDRAPAALRELDPKRKLDENETRAIVRKVDEILGLAPPPSARTDEPRKSRSLQTNGLASTQVLPGSGSPQPDMDPSASPETRSG